MIKFNKELNDIKIYEAGKPIELLVRDYGIKEDNIIKLASNENPNGSSPKVSKKVIDCIRKMYRYPDDSFYEFKNRLSEKFKVTDKNIIIGAGSDQILEFISRSILYNNSNVLMTKVTFAMYEIYAKQMGANIIRTSSYRHNSDEIIELSKKYNPLIVYLCTPNNPTGDAILKTDIFKIIKNISDNILVVIDGAYMEYAKAKDINYSLEPKDILKYSNVIYLGTFSKAYGLGGMRIGYGISNINIIKNLHKMRPPFNITTLSLVAGSEALNDESFINQTIDINTKEMLRYENFAKNRNINYIKSYANFITYYFDEENKSKFISMELLKKGIIIRDLSSYKMNAIRITIGTEKQNIQLLDSLNNIEL